LIRKGVINKEEQGKGKVNSPRGTTHLLLVGYIYGSSMVFKTFLAVSLMSDVAGDAVKDQGRQLVTGQGKRIVMHWRGTGYCSY